MRDILLRQNMGNQTIGIAKLRESNPSTPSSQTGTLTSGNIADAGIDAQLEQARQQQDSRRQQTGDEHRSRLGQGLGSLAASILNLTPLTHLRDLGVCEEIRRNPAMGASCQQERAKAEPVPVPGQEGIRRSEGAFAFPLRQEKFAGLASAGGKAAGESVGSGVLGGLRGQPATGCGRYIKTVRNLTAALEGRVRRHTCRKMPLAVVYVFGGMQQQRP